MNWRDVLHCHQRFWQGDCSIQGQPGSGTTSIITTDENASFIDELIQNDRCITHDADHRAHRYGKIICLKANQMTRIQKNLCSLGLHGSCQGRRCKLGRTCVTICTVPLGIVHNASRSHNGKLNLAVSFRLRKQGVDWMEAVFWDHRGWFSYYRLPRKRNDDNQRMILFVFGQPAAYLTNKEDKVTYKGHQGESRWSKAACCTQDSSEERSTGMYTGATAPIRS